jgi:hypothetical protein
MVDTVRCDPLGVGGHICMHANTSRFSRIRKTVAVFLSYVTQAGGARFLRKHHCQRPELERGKVWLGGQLESLRARS